MTNLERGGGNFVSYLYDALPQPIARVDCLEALVEMDSFGEEENEVLERRPARFPGASICSRLEPGEATR